MGFFLVGTGILQIYPYHTHFIYFDEFKISSR